MDFKNWLLNEVSSGFELKINPEIKSFAYEMKNGQPIHDNDPKKLYKFAKQALDHYFQGDLSNAAARYTFYLSNIRDAYETIFEFDLTPKGGKPEFSSPDHPMHDIYMQHSGGMTGYKIHNTPKEALDEIPDDPTMGYRGMSWEEWQYIRKHGHIQSKGDWNFASQEKLTFYGRADTAAHYSSGFAPMAFQSSQKRPSVVIAVSMGNLKDHNDHPGIPAGELAHIGPLSSKEIMGVWFIVPTKSRRGKLELIFQYAAVKDEHGDYTGNFVLGKPREGSRSSPSVGIAIKKVV